MTMTCEKKPSEIFLRLWQYRTVTDEEATADDFLLCAEIWTQIRELESMATKPSLLIIKDPKEAETAKNFWKNPPEGLITPAPKADDGEGEEPNPKNSHGKTTGEGHGVTAWAVRKRAALGALAKARANGVSLASIADAAGLSLTDVLGLSNGEKKAIPIWSQLERGLKKLGYPPGGPDSASAEELPPDEE